MFSPLIRLAAARPTRSVVNAAFATWSRRRVSRLAGCDPARVQRRTLLELVKAASHTRFGRDHDFGSIDSIEGFQEAVPVQTYDSFWERYLRPSHPIYNNVGWPGQVPYLALTSGTTQGATKFIPVSRAMLKSNYLASRTMMAYHVANRPDSRLFGGRMFFLGGSTDLQQVGPGVRQGDLSGIVATEMSRLSRPYTFPPLELALETDWDRKLGLLAEESRNQKITLIGGVPSWLLLFFDRIRELTGKATIREIWPSLEVVVHGGVKFDPYRESFARALGSPSIATIDAYACSEGFIAFGDPQSSHLRLMFDHGVFYEFVPLDDLDSARPTRHWLGNARTGIDYAIVVSTCAGLWGHVIGDTVRFEQLDPPLLTFTGRTKYSLSAFGEHLINEEIEAAMARAAELTDASVRDWHVGPVFVGSLGYHHFIVEFDRLPLDPTSFRDELDAELRRRNDDYRAHRAEGVGLPVPALTVASPGSFAAWMKARGKLGGQNKVPRMDESGKLATELGAYLRAHRLIHHHLAQERTCPRILARFHRGCRSPLPARGKCPDCPKNSLRSANTFRGRRAEHHAPREISWPGPQAHGDERPVPPIRSRHAGPRRRPLPIALRRGPQDRSGRHQTDADDGPGDHPAEKPPRAPRSCPGGNRPSALVRLSGDKGDRKNSPRSF